MTSSYYEQPSRSQPISFPPPHLQDLQVWMAGGTAPTGAGFQGPQPQPQQGQGQQGGQGHQGNAPQFPDQQQPRPQYPQNQMQGAPQFQQGRPDLMGQVDPTTRLFLLMQQQAEQRNAQFLAAMNENNARLITAVAGNRPQRLRERADSEDGAIDDTPRRQFIKAEDIGFFLPDDAKDYKEAQRFSDMIKDAALRFGDKQVLEVAKTAATKKSTVAFDWFWSLTDDEREQLRRNVASWHKFLRRDFMPGRATLESKALAERFTWAQGRMPSDYPVAKYQLFKAAGWTDEDSIIFQIHEGLDGLNLKGRLPFFPEGGNDLAAYRLAINRHQDDAKAQNLKEYREKRYCHEWQK
ncbi:hypothetical protein BJ508DRAFT_333727 [Ascobolus immersus RN42]|uniref:Uncharacterized protein n=1 Tax=Ascobolus immersus RN42 TaxID=1160509 RepID=A0A3N4HIJ5_ASCIM|nr:hypothetical protein BJ508DRAFT_333727 [Ascobolus immersus RN42]